MDVVGGFHLTDGTELKAVSGIDDNSRFGISATLVRRATAGPVCEALLAALRRHGIPDQILTDNGKVFTGRFGPAGISAEVLFDRICAENGIGRAWPATGQRNGRGGPALTHDTCGVTYRPRSPARHLGELQAALDAWVEQYNTVRPHQALGMRPPSRGSSSPPCPPWRPWSNPVPSGRAAGAGGGAGRHRLCGCPGCSAGSTSTV